MCLEVVGAEDISATQHIDTIMSTNVTDSRSVNLSNFVIFLT